MLALVFFTLTDVNIWGLEVRFYKVLYIRLQNFEMKQLCQSCSMSPNVRYSFVTIIIMMTIIMILTYDSGSPVPRRDPPGEHWDEARSKNNLNSISIHILEVRRLNNLIMIWRMGTSITSCLLLNWLTSMFCPS